MSEPMPSGGGPTVEPSPICPWCSAQLPATATETCPSCGAALHETETSEVPGVTRIDHEALIRSRTPIAKARGLIGWLSGEYEVEAPSTPQGTLEPPDLDVRREMLRLELAALEAEVQARRTEAIAEVAAETGAPVEDLLAAAEAVGPGLPGPAGGADGPFETPDAPEPGDAPDASSALDLPGTPPAPEATGVVDSGEGSNPA